MMQLKKKQTNRIFGIKMVTGLLLLITLCLVNISGSDWEHFVDFTPYEPYLIEGHPDPRVHQAYPSYFDLRKTGNISPHRRSSSWRVSHALTVVSICESMLKPGESWTFSESGMAPHFSQFDFFDQRPLHLRMVVSALASWAGPTAATGYSYNFDTRPGEVQKHLQQMYFLPHRHGLDNDTVKWFIMNHGPVYAGWRFFGDFYDEENSSYYQSGIWGGEQEWPVFGGTIVGWNDNFSRHHFKYPPPGDGAFILKHTFTPNIGDSGYIYISYYDYRLRIRAAFDKLEPLKNYGTNYQHDALGPCAVIGDDSTVYWGANVFTSTSQEPLKAVSFYTNDVHTRCRILVYKNLTGDGPVRGAPAAVKEKQFIYPGYYTVKLDHLVPLEEGEKFSVVVRFENSTDKQPLVVEAPVIDYSLIAEANPGESYVSKNGVSWQDLTQVYADTNACIKAFTAFAPTFSAPDITLGAQMVFQRSWLLSRKYVKLTLDVSGASTSTYLGTEIYRKHGNKDYQHIRSVQITQLTDGRIEFLDEEIEDGVTYTYHGRAYTSDSRINSRTREITVYTGTDQ